MAMADTTRCGDAARVDCTAIGDPRRAMGDPRLDAVRCCAVGYAGIGAATAVRTIMAFAWNGMESRSARPARKTSLFGKPDLETGRDEKARSVVALSRVPRLAGFAGSPPAVDFYRRLTGLLSGSPPTDTRPQARAKMGKTEDRNICAYYKDFFQSIATADTAEATSQFGLRNVGIRRLADCFKAEYGSGQDWRLLSQS